ncbi:Hypothetical protein CINCED_3A003459 [Cinara cedri]|uniref:Reverse transcriptase domain n=1 Tax=Cinara cedri TaxID=506608 RepID=A0A5E4NC78_9HEMI|nr:Hypothetical protein CINCED_3A003459 [Cinara cedri]
MQEAKKAVNSLKNWIAPGTNEIPAEIIKYDGVAQKIWNDEELPEEWNKAIVVPLHKKSDKLNCNNYRRISLLNMTYKKIIRSIQRDNYNVNIGTNKIGILGFADNLNKVGDNGESVAQSTAALINEAKPIGLNVNDNKTKVMELLPEYN